MKKPIFGLGLYKQLVHIHRDDEGNGVNWFGHFGGLHESIAEGFAYEAVLENGKPVVRPVRNGYMVRLYTQGLGYTPLDHFLWMRCADDDDFRRPAGDMVRIPCIPAESVTTEHLYHDPDFKTIQRRIAIVRAIPSGTGAGLHLRFLDDIPCVS